VRNLTLYIVLALICLTAPGAFAQPDTLWSARILATGNPALYRAMNHSSGDFVVVGETNPGITNSNFLAARIASNGSTVWTHVYGGPGSDAAYACIEATDGRIIIAGSSNGGSTIRLLGISAAGDSLWSRTYGGGGSMGAYDMILLQDGNLAVVGFRLGSDNLHSDLWLLKCTISGDTLWTRCLGGSDTDIGYRIHEQPDRTFIIGGYTRSSSAGDYDLWQLHADSSGNLLSTFVYGGIGPDICYDMAVGNGEVYLAGKTTPGTSNLGYLAKTDANGDSIWLRSYSTGGVEEQLRGIVARPSGGAICAGWSGVSWNGRQCWLTAINADGSVAWHWIHGPISSGFYGMTRISGGGYLAYGQISESNVRKGYVLRMTISEIKGRVVDNASGDPVAGAQVQVIGMPQHTITDAHGEFQIGVVSGTYDVSIYGTCISRDTLQGVVVPPDSVGTANFRVNRPQYVQLQSSINAIVHNHVLTSVPFQIANMGTGSMEFRINPHPVNPPADWLSTVPDTGLILPGDTLTVQVEFNTDAADDNGYDFFGTLQILTNACPGSSVEIPVNLYVLDADVHSTTLPRSYELGAYPNPFNPQTTITFSLPQATQLKLAVYDLTGRCVTVMADASYPAGVHRVPFYAGSIPSGLYFVRIESRPFTTTRKIMLIK
jgi:hypothetical protein